MKKYQKRQLLLYVLLFFGFAHLAAHCTRKDNQHEDHCVTRCCYTQQDIKRMQERELQRHKEMKRYDACIFCGCPISVHSYN